MIVPAGAENDSSLSPSPHPVPSAPLTVTQRLDSPEFCVVESSLPGVTPPKTSRETGTENTPEKRIAQSDLRVGLDKSGQGDAAGQCDGHISIRGEAGVVNSDEDNGRGCSTLVRDEGCVALGPFWAGPLFHPRFLAAVLGEVRRSRSEREKQKEAAVSGSPLSAPAREQESATAGALFPPPGTTSRGSGVASIVAANETSSGGRGTATAGVGDSGICDGGSSATGVPATSATSGGPPTLMLASRRQLVFLLAALAGELVDCPLFYALPDVAAHAAGAGSGRFCRVGGRRRKGRGGFPLPSVDVVRVRRWIVQVEEGAGPWEDHSLRLCLSFVLEASSCRCWFCGVRACCSTRGWFVEHLARLNPPVKLNMLVVFPFTFRFATTASASPFSARTFRLIACVSLLCFVAAGTTVGYESARKN